MRVQITLKLIPIISYYHNIKSELAFLPVTFGKQELESAAKDTHFVVL